MLPINAEEQIYHLVDQGVMKIDEQGRVWRLIRNRWKRAENGIGSYLQVRVMIGGKRHHTMAHRLVWRHFNGPIPEGLTINHKDGHKANNRLENLELATYSEQAIHAREVLGKCSQKGEKNNQSKLTDGEAEVIRIRRQNGESLKSIAKDFGISDRTVSKIALGQRRALTG